ncbi:MAG: phosphoribosylglycinamide formyltransferase [Gemmatimonadaceae bacterium]
MSAANEPKAPTRIAILASGGGSNLQSIIEYFSRGSAKEVGTIVLVASNRAESGALQRAEDSGIATHFIADFTSASSLLAALSAVNADLLVLAGYLKLVPHEVVAKFAGRMLNVHPALLPAFGGHGMYGKRVHEAVIASGAKLSGVTVHFVNEEFDRGPIAAQWPVPVLENDTAQTLGERVLNIEHKIFSVVIEAVAAGSVKLDDHGRVLGVLPATSVFATNDPNLFLH